METELEEGYCLACARSVETYDITSGEIVLALHTESGINLRRERPYLES